MRKRLDHRRLKRVLAHIEQHIAAPDTVRTLAALVHLSQFHFSRSFKAATGQSPHRYINGRRLAHAQALLLSGSQPLAYIAVACGFSSQANFTRAFLRNVGITPGRFRALRQEGQPAVNQTATAMPTAEFEY